MPTAGQRVLALDFTAAVTAIDNVNSQLNLTGTPAIGSPELGVTFTAPSSGKALVTLTAAANDSSGAFASILDVRIYEDDAAGAIVVDLNTGRRLQIMGASTTQVDWLTRTDLIEGLTPGQVYYARTYVYATGGTTCDVYTRQISVVPLPA